MLELKNICFSAEGENGTKEILKNINLKIDDGFSVITGQIFISKIIKSQVGILHGSPH